VKGRSIARPQARRPRQRTAPSSCKCSASCASPASCRRIDDFGKLDFAPERRADRVAANMASPSQRRLKIFFDGGCRPNPGRIEVAVVARGVSYYFDDLGSGTSSDAEWLALGLALRLGQSLAERDFDLIGDCANVIAQANGSSPSRTEAAVEHRARFQESASSSAPRRIRWIARTQNLAGIALARRRGR
jgi:ribonuclease HI